MRGIIMKLKVGILGCGSITEFRHAPEYADNKEVEVVAFFDRTIARAEKFANIYGGKFTDDYMEVLEDPTIDAVSICTANVAHYEMAMAAFKHGKHVLCEKPLAIEVEHAKEMLKESKKSGKKFLVGHNQRLADAHIKAKEIIQSGELGKVLTFRAIFGHKGPEYWSVNKTNTTWFFNKEASGLGVTGDIGVHKIDLVRYLLDDEYTEVSCFDGTLDKKGPDGKPIEVIDNMIAILKTAKGSMGTITASWTYYGPENNSVTLYCEKGIMKIYDDPEYQIVVSKFGAEEVFYKVGEIQTNDKQSNSGVIDTFVDYILNGTEPVIKAEEGLMSIKVVAALIESAKSGKAVKL